ncbi:LysR family transcriptional regulator [Bradyrhizobium sp. Cp5.3]|uniref:helix-turn-helix domain-containing protein n=1 Tax=Bradyrhizobium sp. Cp5.3 TaxID=443598 RepID=UPI0018DE3A5F
MLFLRNNLNLSHLRLLIALDTYRSIQRAANYLHITQPAVSKKLAALETGLDLVARHSGFDGLIPSQSRIGKFSGGTRISMLLGAPA